MVKVLPYLTIYIYPQRCKKYCLTFPSGLYFYILVSSWWQNPRICFGNIWRNYSHKFRARVSKCSLSTGSRIPISVACLFSVVDRFKSINENRDTMQLNVLHWLTYCVSFYRKITRFCVIRQLLGRYEVEQEIWLF